MTSMTLISAEELHGELQSPDIVVVDCRFSLADTELGRRQYLQDHISGARYAHLDEHLSGPVITGRTGRHPLPDQTAFIAQLSAWGISNQSRVIAYDGSNGAHAARLWWMLRWVGHGNVLVLDGGYQQWQSSGFPVTSEQPVPTPAAFTPAASLTRSYQASTLDASLMKLVDARDQARFDGEMEPIDPVAGHIPGAVCLPFVTNVDESGRFLPAADLASRFRQRGLQESDNLVCYCGSGVTAAHNILALVHAGYPEPALYPGSWSEWITDPARPIATRDKPLG